MSIAIIAALIILVIAVLYAVFSLSRFRASAGAMSQASAEVLSRLQNVEARLSIFDETLKKNLAGMRREQSDAAEAGRAEQTKNFAALGDAQKALRQRVLDEAKDIHSKYIDPPHTTDFGILYLPVEGLYAEILRIDGLCERWREYRVVPAGPTTICALLNSLQMGLRTLAIEKRSSEVWELLSKVKTEFEKFGAVLDKTREKIEAAGKELEKAGTRTNAINRALRSVQQLPIEAGDEFAIGD